MRLPEFNNNIRIFIIVTIKLEIRLQILVKQINKDRKL